jgi:hypothetical protein
MLTTHFCHTFTHICIVCCVRLLTQHWCAMILTLTTHMLRSTIIHLCFCFHLDQQGIAVSTSSVPSASDTKATSNDNDSISGAAVASINSSSSCTSNNNTGNTERKFGVQFHMRVPNVGPIPTAAPEFDTSISGIDDSYDGNGGAAG